MTQTNTTFSEKKGATVLELTEELSVQIYAEGPAIAFVFSSPVIYFKLDPRKALKVINRLLDYVCDVLRHAVYQKNSAI